MSHHGRGHERDDASARRPPPARAFLDRPIARLFALGVALVCIASLAWLHRADLFPAITPVEVADDPLSRCLSARSGEIDNMVSEGLIDEERARLFKSRAEALCRSETSR